MTCGSLPLMGFGSAFEAFLQCDNISSEPLALGRDATIIPGVRRGTLYSVCGLAMLVWGCPKRQTTTHIIYTPAPPAPTAQTVSESTEAIVIEEPALPETAEPAAPEEPVTPKPAPRRRTPTRPQTPAPSESAPEPEEPPPADVPTLEPREAPGQQAALRQQIQRSQERLRQRIAQLDRQISSAADRRMVDDARSFLAQSERALSDGDLQRALNLTRKTSLLVAALEQER